MLKPSRRTTRAARRRPAVLLLVENVSVPRDRRVWHEARSLHRAGCEVVVVCPAGRDEPAHERLEGVTIHRFPLRPATGGALGYVREYATAFARVARLAVLLDRRHRFDIVHAANPPDVLLPAALPLKLRGARFVFDQHDLAPELYRSRFGSRGGPVPTALRLLERVSFTVADVVISTNESYRRIAMTRGGKPGHAVYIVRNGPDEDFLAPAAPRPELKAGRPFLLAYAGTMAPQDGVDHALRALAVLRARRHDWRAVFAGDGDSVTALRQLTGDLGLEDVVEFPGFLERDDVRTLLSTADVCLAPEPSNPLNDVSTMIKVVEYMALARPIVAFDLAESRFSARDAAVYARPNDERDFARLIGDLLDDPERRRRMGEAGRERAERDLSWASSERALLSAYGSLLGRPMNGRADDGRSSYEAPSSAVLVTSGGSAHDRGGIAIVVVTYERVHLLRQCVENVLSRTSSETREIVIWNNGSTDGTREYLDSLDDPRFKIVHHPTNIGMNAYARAVALTSAEHFIDLDDDVVEAPEGWDVTLRAAFERLPKIGFLAASLVDDEHDTAAWLRYRVRPHAYVEKEVDGTKLIFGPTGGFCTITSRALYDRVGGFRQSSDLFWQEDGEYIAALAEHGYAAATLADLEVRHAGGEHYARTPPAKAEYWSRHIKRTQRKEAAKRLLLLVPPVRRLNARHGWFHPPLGALADPPAREVDEAVLR